MAVKEERRAITIVSDKPAELWIKVLSLVAMITIPLVAVIGGLLITGQKETNAELKNITEKLNAYNAELKTHASRITRAESDVKEVRGVSKENSDRIYILEGKHNGR